MIFTNTTKLKTALAAGFLGVLMTLNPATCCAQMEISPDHYDTADVSAVRTKAKPNRSASSSQSDLNHAAPQKPSAGTRKMRSKKLSPKRQPVQLSAKTVPSDHSSEIR